MRKINCVNCGATKSAMTFSLDPWCGDTCHKGLAEKCGVDQWSLTARSFWWAVDTVLMHAAKVSKKRLRAANPFEILRKVLNAQVRADQFASWFGLPAGALSPKAVQEYRAKPVDWTRRTLFLSREDEGGGVEVRELQQSRTD